MRQILIRVWSPRRKKMSAGMSPAMLAGYLGAIYPNLLDEVYMEYIGNDDLRGKKIYEADICRWILEDREFIGIIVFNKEKSQFGIEIETNLKIPNDIGSPRKPEVIGNIYQNPELIPKV